MSLPLIWSPSAKKEFAALLAYIEEYYGMEINLLHLWDNRMNPDKLDNLLKS